MILYEYCKEYHPEKLCEVSVAWIEGGFSLKKEPAGNVYKIKHADAYLEENELEMLIIYGQKEASHRYYLLDDADHKILFGYDSENHKPSPVFMATLIPAR